MSDFCSCNLFLPNNWAIILYLQKIKKIKYFISYIPSKRFLELDRNQFLPTVLHICMEEEATICLLRGITVPSETFTYIFYEHNFVCISARNKRLVSATFVCACLCSISLIWTLFLSFFSWRAIIDHLMTHDKTTFRDLMSKLYKSLVIFNLQIIVDLMTGCGFRPFTRLGFHNWHLLGSECFTLFSIRQNYTGILPSVLIKTSTYISTLVECELHNIC